MNTLKLSILALASTSLAACSSSGSDTTASTMAATFASQFAYTEKDTAEKALKSDKPLEAGKGTSVGVTHDFSTKTTSHSNGKLVKVTANSSDGYDIEVDGKKVSFSSGDLSNDEKSFLKTTANGGNVTFWDQTNTDQSQLLVGAEGRIFHRLLGYYVYNPDSADSRGMVAIGSETPVDAIKTLNMKATYNGWASVDNYQNTITNNSGSDGRVRTFADLELNADFENNTIKGNLTNVREQNKGDANSTLIPNVSMALNETQITGNGYEGNFIRDSGDGGVVNGVYTGKFYGNEAQETAGTIIGSETEDGKQIGTLIGVFSASKSAPDS